MSNDATNRKELPTITDLASGRTPEGEPFTISAFGSLSIEPSDILKPFLSVDTGVDPELNEPAIGLGASKAFPWSLSIGCAPHPYAILYGILRHRERRWWRKPPKVPSR